MPLGATVRRPSVRFRIDAQRLPGLHHGARVAMQTSLRSNCREPTMVPLSGCGNEVVVILLLLAPVFADVAQALGQMGQQLTDPMSVDAKELQQVFAETWDIAIHRVFGVKATRRLQLREVRQRGY
jgi:hypothetical protein